jgi:Putative polyhydroxyalkanoic acid system protein (PHA_gran_rgn)
MLQQGPEILSYQLECLAVARSITINIPHTLGKAEARRRIASGFGRIREQLTGGALGRIEFQERWDEDRLHFEGTGLGQKLTGRLDVEEDAVQMHLDLPELLTAIAGRIIRASQEAARKLLEKE